MGSTGLHKRDVEILKGVGKLGGEASISQVHRSTNIDSPSIELNRAIILENEGLLEIRVEEVMGTRVNPRLTLTKQGWEALFSVLVL
ncbi:hypothetical protein [Haloglomus halophilum]|uniref:hypothetical protein n=1 Tax=Haloglomus halophilum TaxID=2962672 RepID=UPI0020C9D7F7|nr:hypothetical protein [Haloglomus halophilum]